MAIVIRPVTQPVEIKLGENTGEAARQAARARAAADEAMQAGTGLTTADEIETVTAGANDLAVSVSQGIIRRFGVDPVSFSGNVTLEAPATATVTDAPATLTYVNGVAAWPFLTAKLAHGNVTGLVVKDVTTEAVLTAGTDYVADLRFGALGLASSGSPRDVLVSYVGSAERYDLIYVDPEFASVGVVTGEEGIRDASERMPSTGTVPSGATLIDMRLPLYHARVTASSVDLVPVWNVRAGIARELERQVETDLRRNQEAIAPFLAALRNGQATTWSAMGDSITALQSDVPSTTVPNGAFRDRATASGTPNTYLREGVISSDLIDAIPSNFSNGTGTNHTRFGRVWELLTEASSRYDGAITYRNYSIAGTNSDDSEFGMTNPTRLAAWAEDGSDLGIIATGMNDTDINDFTTGNPTVFFNRVRSMIEAKYAAGAKGVIVWGCSRPQTGAMSTALWLRINRVLRFAAQTPVASGRTAAFIDPVIISYGVGIGSLGLAEADLCLANGYNHPGIRQHAIEGLLGRRVIFGGA